MATIQRRETLKGISFRVVWRDDSKHKVRTFTTEDRAKDWKGVSYWRNHVEPTMGQLPVRQIRPDDIRALVHKLESVGRAPKTIHNVCGFLAQVLNHAVTMGWAPSSPYSAKLLPENKAVKAERDNFLAIQEANMIIDATRSHQDAVRMLQLSTLCGTRTRH